MRIEATKKLFTVDEYYRMGDAGIFKPEARTELIEGEVIEMSPIGDRHAACVNHAVTLLVAAFSGKATVSVQNPVHLNMYSVPQPDVVLAKLREDFYVNQHLSADDTLLVIEVSDSTLNYDRKIKLPIYARAGVPEVWIEDLKKDRILVYRNPVGSAYASRIVLDRNGSVSPLAFPDTALSVGDLLLTKYL